MSSETETIPRPDNVEFHWIAGCSRCSRMKEFVEKTRIEHEAFNIALDANASAKLERLGALVPAVVVGDRRVRGVDLAGVASLLGVGHTQPVILPTPAAAAGPQRELRC